MKNSFRFGSLKGHHIIGDEACKGCRWDVPLPCPWCDTGLVHIEFIENFITDPFVTLCDVCRSKNRGIPPAPARPAKAK